MAGIAELMLQDGLISELDLTRATGVSLQSGGRLLATFARLGIVADIDLAVYAAKGSSLPLANRDTIRLAPDIPGLNNRFLADRFMVPLALENRQLRLAVADPDDAWGIEAMLFATGAEAADLVIASFSEIEEAIGTHDDPIAAEALRHFSGEGSATDDLERVMDIASDAPVIRLVHRLMTQAVNRRASDIHLEPMARYLAVRYRIDGRLVEVEKLPDNLASPVASRIKVMAGLDIAETRLPQDGRLKLTVRGRDVDVRVSTSPITHGESIVLRLLGRSEVPLDLDKLGLPNAAKSKLFRALERPHGIILLTGPTGSGKTTTLYAAINRLRRPDVKILTVEDPVEVLLEGINQVQVRPDIDLSYATTLRAFLRQDPDILMIGEIRDRETAEIAMRAALTGHLVLSTLHTNSALGAFTRLDDIGIEPYLTASTVIATIAQRLIRALCTDCAVPRDLAHEEIALYRSSERDPPSALFEPGGCPRCGGSGFSGRVPMIEILEVDEPVREAIRTRTIEQMAPSNAAETLLGHGLHLAAIGRTSLAEVVRAVQVA